MQIDRLFQIVYILLDKEQITARQLSEILNVSTRTIYRDIEKISVSGIPIYTDKGKGGGIRLLNNFILNKSILSNEEQNNLLIGLEILKSTEYKNVDSALLKLRNLFNKNTDSWIEVDFSNWGSSKEERAKFEMLKFSLTNCRIIKFYYYKFSGDKTNRTVYPIKLIFKHKAWYLQGFCLTKNDFRIFKIHRIKDLTITQSTFDREPYNLAKAKFSYENISEVINLKFMLSSQVKHRVYDEFDEKDITKNEDGSFHINIKAREDEWLYNYIISFGEYINIIEPKYIDNIIKSKLKKILKSYK